MKKIIVILILAFALRLYGLNWDNGFHLHPDERMLIMVADRIHFFDQLNPDFFNYGSLPIYLLKGLAQFSDRFFATHFANYDGLLYIGRLLSVFSDVITVFLIYKIAHLLFESSLLRIGGSNHNIPLISAFFYTIAFFPIQNSHFFVVDVFLTTLTTSLLYLLLLYIKSPSLKKVVLMSIIFAGMLATKVTGMIFYPLIILTFLIPVIPNLAVIPNLFRDPMEMLKRVQHDKIKQFLFHIVALHVTCLMFYALFMPYAFIQWQRFLADVMAQTRMNSDAYVFPYTLQYVGTLPYIYYIKNIVLWGLGPIISLLSLIGMISLFKDGLNNLHSWIILKIKNKKLNIHIKDQKYFILNMCFLYFIFYFLYFVIIGRSAVKFMRYMLPLYPFLCIMAAYGLTRLKTLDLRPKNISSFLLTSIVLVLTSIWSFMFINIYSTTHSRITATEWILHNIPSGSNVAYEHWDDRVPLYGGEKYNFVELPLYERPDDEAKWQVIDLRLKTVDYIIIASNRLYIPLQRLNDCSQYKSCYPITAKYYQDLFNGKLNFAKIAEFTSYPHLESGNWNLEFNDDSADESFTVYDHPKVLIFQRKSP